MRLVQMKRQADPWVVCPRPNPNAKLRLFCFPYAGGDASIFQSWPASLPASVEVCALRLPGRSTRLAEPPFTALEPLVETVAEAISPHLLGKPFAFFGHSMGAILGFELVHLFHERLGLTPAHLFVSGHAAPHIPRSEPPTYDLPEPEFVAKIRQLNGTPGEVLDNRELLQIVLPTLRADFAVCETYVYRHRRPLPCPISTYGGLGDESVSRSDLQAWRLHTRGGLTVRMFPGDHFFIHSAKSLVCDVLARDLYASTFVEAESRNVRGEDRACVA